MLDELRRLLALYVEAVEDGNPIARQRYWTEMPAIVASLVLAQVPDELEAAFHAFADAHSRVKESADMAELWALAKVCQEAARIV